MIEDKLYEQVFRFRELEPWKYVTKYDIFAVKFSDDKIGYISVVGAQEDTHMILLYVDDAINELIQLLHNSSMFRAIYGKTDVASYQDCIGLSFRDKKDVSVMDANDIKNAAKRLSYKLSGQYRYPFFFRYKPDYASNTLTSTKDMRYLTEALEAANHLFECASESKDVVRLITDPEPNFLLLTKGESGWYNSKTHFKLFPKRKNPVPSCENEVGIQKLKQFDNKISFECQVCKMMYGVKDDVSGEYKYPTMLFAVNERSSFNLPVKPVLSFYESPDTLMNEFINSLVKFEICPSAIFALNTKTYDFFKPLCDKLSIELHMIPHESDFIDEQRINTSMELGKNAAPDYEAAAEEFERLITDYVYNLGNQKSFSSMKSLLEALGLTNEKISSKEEKMIDLGIKRRTLQDDDIDVTYEISVSLQTGCYRHIRVPSGYTLEQLHDIINESFGFDDDHLHAFFMNNRMSPDEEYLDVRAEEAGDASCDVTLGQFGLQKGSKFKYLFDFGDEWLFQCKVNKVLNEHSDKAKVIKIVGEAPEQYPEYDDNDDDYFF